MTLPACERLGLPTHHEQRTHRKHHTGYPGVVYNIYITTPHVKLMKKPRGLVRLRHKKS